MKQKLWIVVFLAGLIVLSLCGLNTPAGKVDVGDVVRLISGVTMTITGFTKGIIKGRATGGGNVEIHKTLVKKIVEKGGKDQK